ncbi:MAG: LacI family DNA-binding transcriptional regulator [Anaerolineales bacterium]|nr:LacI family DNA-binding transcriptional regulator [Anaerolineales bacterium]MBP6208522.1 LacI family DNA-binding transcriptional regulator [Anaerolineales bacterium]MBP8163801.1 LacI family DNA-binding transcriptional regulator [Anaerolineales bacterium]
MPRKKTPTIYDVAELSGVSISTISRVLNAPDKVNTETHRRVIEAIDKLGFVPKAEARARAMRNTGRIGVLTPFFTAPSFVQRLRGVASALSKANYELVVYTVESAAQLENYFASIPLTSNLDGLIIMSLSISEENAHRLTKYNIPAVLIEYPHPTLSSVEIDDVEGGRMAAEYLIKKGHRRIAFLGDTDLPEYAIHPVSLRLSGFRQSLQNAGIEIPDEFVRLAPYTQEQTLRVANELLNLPNPPTAIFAATDFQALGVLKAARTMKVQVPEQVAIVGFDDLDLADYADLTTIRQHLDESGRLSVEILLSRIDDPSRPAQHIHLPLTLIERQTA